MKTIRLSEQGEREDQGAAMILALILLMMLYVEHPDVGRGGA